MWRSACGNDDPFAGVLAARSGLFDDVMGRLSMFGVIQEACVPADIRADFTEQLARSIHSAKVAMGSARGFTPATDPEMLPWESLPEDLRQLNFAQAADIGAKLEAIGAIVVPQSAAAPAFAFADQEIENLARLQHEWRCARDSTRGGDTDRTATTSVGSIPNSRAGITSARPIKIRSVMPSASL